MAGKIGKSDIFQKNCYNGYYTYTEHLEPKMSFNTPDEVVKYVEDYERWVNDVVELYEEFKKDYEANREEVMRKAEEYKEMMKEMC